jgi:hypothetical protein
MAWEATRIDETTHEKYDFTFPQKPGVTEPASTAHDMRPADFTDIVTNELVLIGVTSYLTVPSLLSLSSTSKEIRSILHTTPNVWRTVDLSDLRSSSTYLFLIKFLRQPYVSRDCRVLILDGLSFDHRLLYQIVLREMPLLHSISLRSCPDLDGDQIIELIDYIRRPENPRPLGIKYMSLLGDSLFPLDQPSELAPIVVDAAGMEIITDLHSRQCPGEDHREADTQEGKWHLKFKYPNHPCTNCQIPQDICKKCHDKQSCARCNSFYCEECEPHPIV